MKALPPYSVVFAAIVTFVLLFFLVVLPSDAWFAIFAPRSYDWHLLTTAQAVPIAPYRDDLCPWRVIRAWQRARAADVSAQWWEDVAQQAEHAEGRVLALAGLMPTHDSAVEDWLRSRAMPESLRIVQGDWVRVESASVVYEQLRSGQLTVYLDSVDMRTEDCVW